MVCPTKHVDSSSLPPAETRQPFYQSLFVFQAQGNLCACARPSSMSLVSHSDRSSGHLTRSQSFPLPLTLGLTHWTIAESLACQPKTMCTSILSRLRFKSRGKQPLFLPYGILVADDSTSCHEDLSRHVWELSKEGV